MSKCNLDYKRVLNKGKSFECSKWQPFVTYTNDCIKQDFVTIDEALFVCVQTHLSSEDNKPEVVYGDVNNPHKPTGSSSPYWEYVLSGFSDWNKLSEVVQKEILKKIDGLDTYDTEVPNMYVSSVLQEDGKLTIRRKNLPSSKVSVTNDYFDMTINQSDGGLSTLNVTLKDIAKASDVENIKKQVDELDFIQSLTKITYTRLRVLRNNGHLIPGTWYRITDYVTTTTQENTQSAGHPFDIIVFAESESILSEKARAIQHDGDTYFANNNLNAWELWYCLDNDTQKFKWADINGNGVIYRMIDEFGNDCPYDFKNIQFKRKLNFSFGGIAELDDSGVDTWVYTFAGQFYDYTNDTSSEMLDGSLESPHKYTSDKGGETFHHNIIKPYVYMGAANWKGKRVLNDIVLLGFFDVNLGDNDNIPYPYGCAACSFGINCHDITLGHNCNNITFGNYCHDNILGKNAFKNIFGNYCRYNVIGNGSAHNTFGDYCEGNELSNDCNANTFAQDCIHNRFGIHCDHNIFDEMCSYNSFAGNCGYNAFESLCIDNSYGFEVHQTRLGFNCYNNSFDSDCSCNSLGNNCHDNTFKGDCYYNSLGNNCSENYFNISCYNNILNDNCTRNRLAMSCSDNSFGIGCNYNHIDRPYTNLCHFDNGCDGVWLTSLQSTSSVNYLQNIYIHKTTVGQFTIDINTLSSETKINVFEVKGYIYVLKEGENIYKTTYNNLVYLRERGLLIPGLQYRITDYKTTTSQPHTTTIDTEFDIIVTAIDDHTLSEDAKAIAKSSESSNFQAWELKYSLDNDTSKYAWAGEERVETNNVAITIHSSSNCTINPELINGNKFITPLHFESCVWVDAPLGTYDGESSDDLHEPIYEWGYFNDENDSVQLCLHILDEDAYQENGVSIYGDRFLYRGIITVDGTDYDYWQKWEPEKGVIINNVGDTAKSFATTQRIVTNPENYYTEETTKVIEETTPLQPKGVIYYMKDEYGNECSYDFKTIMFKRCKVTTTLEGADKDKIEPYYVGYLSPVSNDSILPPDIVATNQYKYCYTFQGVSEEQEFDASRNSHGLECANNKIEFCIDEDEDIYHLNDIVIYTHVESPNKVMSNNHFARNCYSMTIGSENTKCEVWDNKFGQFSRSDIFVGPTMVQNTIGSNCAFNCGFFNFAINTIRQYCQYNKFNDNFSYNNIDVSMKNNYFMRQTVANNILFNCMQNTINSEFSYNNIAQNFKENVVTGARMSSNSIGVHCIANTISGDFAQNVIGSYYQHNSINQFVNSKTAINFAYNILPNVKGCTFNTVFVHNNILSSDLNYSTFGNYIVYNDFISDGAIVNINVANNIQGTSDKYNELTIPTDMLGNIKISKNSKGEIKIYCEADLIA